MFPPTAWEGFLVTTPSPALYVDLSLTAILAGVRRYLFVVLISVSLIVMLSIFSCTSWPSICLLWRNVYLDLLPISWLRKYVGGGMNPELGINIHIGLYVAGKD